MVKPKEMLVIMSPGTGVRKFRIDQDFQIEH